MSIYTESIFVNRSAEEAFDFCTNNAFFDRWMPNIYSSKVVSGEELSYGAKLEQEIFIGKKVEKLPGQVTVFEPSQRWSYTLRGADVWIRRTWVLEPLSKGTKIHYTEEINQGSGGLFSTMSKFFSKTPQASGVLQGLKRDLESKGRYLPELV